DEVHKRATEFMELVQIGHLADRMPDKLSGGQQQRVALARALCTHPDVLLMDEPLSNLDAKLRVDMRTAIKDIQRRVGTTTVYVTHDQEEAMAISDRIAVMKDGYIQHLGTPEELYHRPANVFVANFIGRSNHSPRTSSSRTSQTASPASTASSRGTAPRPWSRARAPGSRCPACSAAGSTATGRSRSAPGPSRSRPATRRASAAPSPRRCS